MKTPPLPTTTCRAMILLALMPSVAFAAQQPDQPPPPPPPPAEAQPAPSDTAPPAPEAPAAPAGPSVEDRLTEVEGKLEGLQESTAETSATVGSLKKIKLSGYVQGRYEWHDDAGGGLDANNRPRGTNRFLVRRARLKTTYQGTLSEFVLQLDAVPDGVTLKDAEASLFLDESVIPSATPFELRLTVGQFKVPFGFELLQSSSDREMPERTTMIRQLYNGERDRGVRLQAKYGVFRLSTALINGNAFSNLTGPDVSYGSLDHSSFKDIVGRVGADLGIVVIGGSAHWGHTTHTTAARMATATSPATPVSYLRFERLRLGADAQAYFDVPAVGGLVLRGEFIYAADKNLDYAGVTKSACRDIKSLGWYATVVQNIGDHVGVVFRVDQFDRNGDVEEGCTDAVKNAAKIDKITSVGGGLLVHVSGNLKATVAYEHIGEQGANAKDNDILYLQLQSKF